MNAFQVIWWLLIGLILSIYMILDGFDLGVGSWYLFTHKDDERKSLMRSILPYWDGNEVWLLTGGGAVFAAFPAVYASIFSGFYLALMIVLFGLIFRAVAIEFRNQSDSKIWRRAWDFAFSFGSIVPALLFGVAAGNIIRGLPLDAKGNFVGSFFDLLNPYSLMLGVTGLVMFATHGALFAAMKTEGNISERAATWAKSSSWIFLVLLIICTVITLITQQSLMANYYDSPVLFIIPALTIIAVLMVCVFSSSRKIWRAFLSSCLGMIGIMASIGAGLFPNMIPASNNPAYSLTLMNASSTPLTLKVMLIIALIGVPIVLAYTAWVHIVFRGKVGEEAY